MHVRVVIPCALRRESIPLRKMVQSCGSDIARNQCGTGEEQRRCLPLRIALRIVQKGDGE